MQNFDCCFTKDNNWFRYRAGAIIVENGCVLFAGNEPRLVGEVRKARPERSDGHAHIFDL